MPRRRLVSVCLVAPLLVLAACGQGGDGSEASSAGDEADRVESTRQFAQCMRDNGVPDYPDPDPSGQQGAGHEAFDRDNPTFKAAYEECRDLLPGGGEHERLSPEEVEDARRFAQCMRDNGVPDFPDPNADGSFPEEAERGAHDDPEFQAASEACREDLPQHGGG